MMFHFPTTLSDHKAGCRVRELLLQIEALKKNSLVNGVDLLAQLEAANRLYRELLDAAYEYTVNDLSIEKKSALMALVQKGISDGPTRVKRVVSSPKVIRHCVASISGCFGQDDNCCCECEFCSEMKAF